jgi:hypothetical protein
MCFSFFRFDLNVASITSLLREPFSSLFLSLPRSFSPEIFLHFLAPLAAQVHSVVLSMASSLAPASLASRLQSGGAAAVSLSSHVLLAVTAPRLGMFVG